MGEAMTKCTTCGGAGTVRERCWDDGDGNFIEEHGECPTCSGTGEQEKGDE